MYILFAVTASHESLLGIVADTNQMRRVARNTRDFGQSTSDELGLIIPAFPLTNRMQRNRDNQIDPIEEIGLGKLHRGNACQIVGNIGAMAILEQMD